MHNLLRVDPPALVDLFEQQESRVFRFPAKQQQTKKNQHWRPMKKKNTNGLMLKICKIKFGSVAKIQKIMLLLAS